MTATANVVHEATDPKQVGQRDQNEATGTKHAAQVMAARKHHQNPMALVEALKKADAAPPRSEDIAMPDRKLVNTVPTEDGLVWIAVQDIVPLKWLSEAPAADDLIPMHTHATVDQIIDDRASARMVAITDHSSVHILDTSVMAGGTSDSMPKGMAAIIPGSTHDTVRCTIVDSAHKVAITDHSSVHIEDTSVTAGDTLDIMPVDMVGIILDSIHDMVRCTTVDSAHKAVITVHSSVHTAATSVTVDPTLDTTPGDTAVTIPGSTHDMVRCTIADLARRVVITDHSSVRTADTSATVDPTLDIMQVDTAINSVPILAHNAVAPDINSDHTKATAHISAHAL